MIKLDIYIELEGDRGRDSVLNLGGGELPGWILNNCLLL